MVIVGMGQQNSVQRLVPQLPFNIFDHYVRGVGHSGVKEHVLLPFNEIRRPARIPADADDIIIFHFFYFSYFDDCISSFSIANSWLISFSVVNLFMEILRTFDTFSSSPRALIT